MSTPPPGDKDVLGSLPHSRPGRSTARREAARAKRVATTAKPTAAPRAPAVAKAGAPTLAAAPKPAAAKQPAAAKTARPARIPAPVAKAADSEGRAKALKAPRKAAVTVSAKRQSARKPGVAPVPPAGWAVPGNGHGSADPAGALVKLADAGAGILRGILSRLPS